ncbi:MAG: hypothetical protein ACXWP4_03620 [Polyangiales bacterium]
MVRWRCTIVATALAVMSFACGARTPLEAPGASADASPGSREVTLVIPVGLYADCIVNTVNIREKLEAAGGGRGSVTLSADADGHLSASLSFDRWMRGTLAFAPTSDATAASTGGPVTVETVDTDFATPLELPVAAASLMLVGDRLFLSLYGHRDTKLSGFVSCPIPAGMERATIKRRADAIGSIPLGTYAGCTTASGGWDTSITSGGDLSLRLEETSGVVRATSVAGFPDVCSLAFDGVLGPTATLIDGETCPIAQPCGPPPTLGPSSAPREATLTHMAGAMLSTGGALFVSVIGDAPADACGRHFVSLICPTAP